MAYRLSYSDYTPPAAPPAPAVVPPTPESIPGGPAFIGLPQPPDVPCDPTGDGWRGPPGPTGPPGTTALIQVQDTPPTYPQPGQLWFDSSNPQLYVWYVDPTSAQWVIATAYAGGLTTDAPSDGHTYARKDGAWVQIA
jgi:hypothetical protein